MKVIIRKALPKILFILLFLTISKSAFGQAKCFSPEEAEKAVNLINAAQTAAENQALRRELLEMQDAQQKLEQKIIDNREQNRQLIASADETGAKHLLRWCEIIKQNGWTRKELVGEDGAAAALFIIKSSRAFGLQREIFPVVVAAAKKGFIGNGEVAWLIDSIRVGAGQTQIFGTQTTVKDEIFYLYPLENDAKVEEWRKLYNLAPLSDFIKFLQYKYQTVVVKSPRRSISPPAKERNSSSSVTAAAANPLVNLEPSDVIKVESSLVNLNVRVSSADAGAGNLNLQKNDFAVFEDGKKQEISFFSATDAPFDLILLLDLSGSTSDKQDLIRKSTRRFIEAARPADRIAIVTFTDEARIVHDLTQNRDELLKSVKKIKDSGGSAVWGSLEFVFDKIIKPESARRRSAIVLMTDGVDSSFAGLAFSDSYPTFTNLLETVRKNDATIIPIYLDTESESRPSETAAYRTARRTLQMLADETGGELYYAKKVNDLNGIYEKIIEDLSRIYSLGYQPTGDNGGAWHNLNVTVSNHPNAVVRTKRGYYGK